MEIYPLNEYIREIISNERYDKIKISDEWYLSKHPNIRLLPGEKEHTRWVTISRNDLAYSISDTVIYRR